MTDTAKQEVPELLPCPFCGGQAAWGKGEQKTKYGNEQVYCSDCLAITAPEGSHAEAAENWNNRAWMPAPVVSPARIHAEFMPAAVAKEVEQIRARQAQRKRFRQPRPNPNWPIPEPDIDYLISLLPTLGPKHDPYCDCGICAYCNGQEDTWGNTRVHADSEGGGACEVCDRLVGVEQLKARLRIPAAAQSAVAGPTEDAQCEAFQPSVLGVPAPEDRCVKVRGHEGKHSRSSAAVPTLSTVDSHSRAEAINLLRSLRETNDPVEIERQRESWAQLQADLSTLDSVREAIRRAAEEIQDWNQHGEGQGSYDADVAYIAAIISKHFPATHATPSAGPEKPDA